jgi:hypothetical protein
MSMSRWGRDPPPLRSGDHLDAPGAPRQSFITDDLPNVGIGTHLPGHLNGNMGGRTAYSLRAVSGGVACKAERPIEIPKQLVMEDRHNADVLTLRPARVSPRVGRPRWGTGNQPRTTAGSPSISDVAPTCHFAAARLDKRSCRVPYPSSSPHSPRFGIDLRRETAGCMR